MTQRFFSHDELQNGVPGLPDTRYLLYTACGPVPAPLLVWRHPQTGEIVLRLTNMTPLSWEPFSMLVNVSLNNTAMVETLQLGATCVMAWGGRDVVRASYLAALDMPMGLDQIGITRLHTVLSPYGPVPHIAECPLNMECHVDRILDWGRVRTYWLIVDYMSLDEEILTLPREVVLQRYHLYEVDRVDNGVGGEQLRLGMGGALFECPSFPVGPKQGWYATFPQWVRELSEEGYLSAQECAQILAWHDRWLAVFDDLSAPERQALREHLTQVCTALSWREWPALHRYLESQRT
jgi:flavin reductase (DIM6/NTAB) family NADH-FMN oxidoreductase RutF